MTRLVIATLSVILLNATHPAPVVAFSPTPPIDGADEFRCNYTRKLACSASGCQTATVGSAYLLMPHVDSLLKSTLQADDAENLPTIRRCDANGCTAVSVRALLTGAFMNITQPDGAYFFRIATVDLTFMPLRRGDFVEVASFWLDTVIYYGSCTAVVK